MPATAARVSLQTAVTASLQGAGGAFICFRGGGLGPEVCGVGYMASGKPPQVWGVTGRDGGVDIRCV
eukprot:352382-Chlamydomonas_euryale.AAC.3